MKRCIAVTVILIALTGCGKENSQLEEAMRFRDRLLEAEGCSFDAEITADYGDEVHIFSMNVTSEQNGDVSFGVTDPEVISGITGVIEQSQAYLTFDETILAFPMLAEGQLAPVTAPWIVLKALRSGYISCVGTDGEFIRLTLLDSYLDDALTVDVWFEEGWTPVQGEILYKNEKILTLRLENFSIL